MYKRYAFFLVTVPISANCFAGTGLEFLMPNTVVKNACVYSNTGVYQDQFTMVPVYEDTVFTCNRGYYLPRESEICVLCLADMWCPGGEYTYSITADVGINPCSDGLHSPVGMWESAQCGKLFHVGDASLYLRTAKSSAPSFHFDINGDGVADMFANMTTLDVPMNINTERKLKVRVGETTYSVYDDTIDISQINKEEQ